MNYRILLRGFTYILLIAGYLLFPIWMLLDNIILQIIFVFSIAFIVPEVLVYLIDEIVGEKEKQIDSIEILRRNKVSLLYFLITTIAYTIMLLPFLLAPLKPIDDEAAHIGRIVFLEGILTLGSRLSPLLVGVALFGVIILVVFTILMASGFLGENKLHFLLKEFFAKSLVTRIFHIIVGAVFSVLVVLSSSFTVYEWHIARFGPLQPVTYVTPLLLFGYSDMTLWILRFFDIILMVLSAVLIKKITIDLISSYSDQEQSNRKVIEILGMLSGWIFLVFTPTFLFSVQVMLTAGVSFFFTLNCFLFVRYFRSIDIDKSNIYLVTLFTMLAVGSLWKRVILVQASTFILILLVWALTQLDRKESILLWFKSCLLYLMIFGPWFAIVQLGGSVTREYTIDPASLLPPGLFDYLYRLDLQMGVFLGVLGYMCLGVLAIVTLRKRSWVLSGITLSYATWYLFFNLDAGWAHIVDRFFVPALSILAISICFVIGVALDQSRGVISDLRNTSQDGSISLSQFNARKLTIIAVTIVLITPLALGVGERAVSYSQQLQDVVDNEYLAYDEAAAYIHSIIQENSDLLYSRFGQSGLNYYMRSYGDYYYTISGFGETWIPEPDNESAGHFLEYLREHNYTVLAMPDAEFCQLELPNATAIITELIDNYSSYAITEYRAFTYGSTSFHVWVI
jgi:hypothetical protein